MPFQGKTGQNTVRNTLKSIADNLVYFESRFCRRLPKEKNGTKHILILRKDGLGDCIIFYPTLATYHEFYKNTKITLVFPKVFEGFSPLLDSIDKVIWFDAKRFSNNFFYRRKFLLDLYKANYDIALYPVFTREVMGDFMIKMTRAKETIGFVGKDNSVYNRTITPPQGMNLEIDRDRYFAESVTGKKFSLTFPTIDIKKLPKGTSDELIEKHSLKNKPFVIVFPGGGEPYKIWQAQKFASIIDYLVNKNITPVICGNEKERKLAKEILSYSKSTDKVIDLAGQTDLPTLAHLLIGAKFYFGSDTGILHLAVALKKPSIALVWQGSLGRFYPYGDPRYNIALSADSSLNNDEKVIDEPLLELKKLHPSIENISVEQVIAELEKMLSKLGTTTNDHE